jgi:MFS transporter, PPP family, 3-phenylpropionic acid transporter
MRAAGVLSLYWFVSLAGLGAFFPFYSLYLSENVGLTGSQVGMVMATLPLVGMLAQPFWGQVADRTGSRTRVLTLISLGAAAGYAALYLGRGFGVLLAGTAALAVFSTAVIPTCVSVTLALVQEVSPHAFGLVRVWGTIGYLVSVVGFPKLLDRLQAGHGLTAGAGGPSEPGLEVMLLFTAGCLLTAAGVSLVVPHRGAVVARAAKGDWHALVRHPPFVRVVLFTFAAYLFLQGPLVLFPVYVRSLGGGIEVVSRMWILMLVLEIPLVALSGAGLGRLGARGLIAVGVAAGALRWLVCGLTTNLSLIYAVQVLHGVTVAGLILGAPLYVDAVVPPALRSTGQGMLAMVGMSLGGILSTLSTGWLLEHVGGAAPALYGGIGAAGLVLAVPWVLPEARHIVPAPERARAEIGAVEP